MIPGKFVDNDEIRSRFSAAMSDMYRQEVPQYGTLLDIVADANAVAIRNNPALGHQLSPESHDRLSIERHGAIRLGSATELNTVRRVFAVMGMQAVGYYDLSVAGVPVHSTAFRPVTETALLKNPFRVFTSLLRLELVKDRELRTAAANILKHRQIFTPRAIQLVEQWEREGGLTSEQADEFVATVIETFRWHSETTVSANTYKVFHDVHRLIADVVCFKGPHINHLTPRTLDIDAVQDEMPRRGISSKEIVEGAPRRNVPILLRQTSFKALEEQVIFMGEKGPSPGTHTARFGEVEQRGIALTRKGRALYDELLLRVRQTGAAVGKDYQMLLAKAFGDFPDDADSIRRAGLGFFRFSLTPRGDTARGSGIGARDVEELIADNLVYADPIIYEDFLPVSAAGIFQSNLGEIKRRNYEANIDKAALETALGTNILDEMTLYEEMQAESIEKVRQCLGKVERT